MDVFASFPSAALPERVCVAARLLWLCVAITALGRKLQAVGVTALVDKVLHGDGDGEGKAQAAAQEAAYNDAEAVAYGGASPKADTADADKPSGDNTVA